MELALFKEHLQQAVNRVHAFTQGFVEEPLPDRFIYRLRLNASYDGNPLVDDEKVYPEDRSPEVSRRYLKCSFDDVLACLWRDGFVPEWINVSVIAQFENYTLIELLSCGRFTAKKCGALGYQGPILTMKIFISSMVLRTSRSSSLMIFILKQ